MRQGMIAIRLLITFIMTQNLIFSGAFAAGGPPVPVNPGKKTTRIISKSPVKESATVKPAKNTSENKIITAIDNTKNPDQNIIDIKAEIKQEKPELKITEPKKLEGTLFQSDSEKLQQTFQMQKKLDIDDIRVLWEASVERNTVIKFALKKLAMPPEQRRIHSSMMAKSVSALIYGASLLPGIMGVDAIFSTSSAVSGGIANRIIENKTAPKVMPLTDTELIQLAKLVDSLQDSLIKNYYDYKSSIDALKVCRQNLLLYNKNYSEALSASNSISIIASSALYDKELLNEMRLRQQIKLSRLELERLAGPETVSKLNLTKVADVEKDKIQEAKK